MRQSGETVPAIERSSNPGETKIITKRVKNLQYAKGGSIRKKLPSTK